MKDEERNEPIERFRAVLERLDPQERWALLSLFDTGLEAQLNRKSDDMLVGLRAMEDVLRQLAGGGFTFAAKDQIDAVFEMLERDKPVAGFKTLKRNWKSYVQELRDAKSACPSHEFIAAWKEATGTNRQKAAAVQLKYGGTLEAHEKRARRYRKELRL